MYEKKSWAAISANMVKFFSWRSQHVSVPRLGPFFSGITEFFFKRIQIFCSPIALVHIFFEISPKIFNRPSFWHICRIAPFWHIVDLIGFKVVLNRMSIMTACQVWPKYVLTWAIVFTYEWYHSFLYTFFQVHVLIDCQTTWTNIGLAHSSGRNQDIDKQFWFIFWAVIAANTLRSQIQVTAIKNIVTWLSCVTKSEVGFVIENKI